MRVKYVQFDQPFFQMGKGYIYELQCEKFEYSGEDFQTGILEIDETCSPFCISPTVEFYVTGRWNMVPSSSNETVRIFDLNRT